MARRRTVVDRERLIEAIMKCFKEFEGDHGVNPDGGGSWWTKEIKTRLCKIGNDLGYYTCASQVDRKCVNQGEWLFDVAWLDWEKKDKKLKSVPLVAESEWGDLDHIRDDFQKLLVARADVRLMVCDAGWICGDDSNAQKTAKQLCRWIKAFKGSQAGDTYLLVAWERDKKSKLWRSHRYRITATGEDADAELIEPSRLPVR